MKTKYSLLLFFLLFIATINAIAQVTEHKTLTTTPVAIGKFSKGQQYQSAVYQIGRIFPTADSASAIFRSYYVFDLSPITCRSNKYQYYLC